MALHKNLAIGDIHVPYQWTYADAAERTGATGFVASDVGKFARQLDDNTVWMLTAITPTWVLAIPLATTSSDGLLSATDKVKIDAFAQGNVTIRVKNSSGSVIEKGRLVVPVGWDSGEGCITVDHADKDDPALRPAVGITLEEVGVGAVSDALIAGVISDIDTSAYALTDQLVLGNSGQLVRPPPDTDPFTGEIQNIGSVTRVHATEGRIAIFLEGQNVVTAGQVFALVGTSGTPSKTNKFVTDADSRLANTPRFRQSAFANIAADTTSTSTSFADLLSVTLTTGVGYLLIFATGSISNSNASKEMYLRVLVDDVAVRGATIICTKLNVAEGFAIALRVSVTAASHTVKLQWKTVANTMQCRPITAAVDMEHASLLVEEVTT